MNIYQAAITARDKKEMMFRTQTQKNCAEGQAPKVVFKPTNGCDCCIIYVKRECDEKFKRVASRWNPELEDLIALDWETIKLNAGDIDDESYLVET